jgi:hypothetical protein
MLSGKAVLVKGVTIGVKVAAIKNPTPPPPPVVRFLPTYL